MDVAKEGLLREVMRHGERMIAMQTSAHDAEMRRTGDLLRLAVAVVGGVIVLVGILSAADVAVGWPPAILVGAGVFLVVSAAVILALVLSGRLQRDGLAFGPELEPILSRIKDPDLSEATVLRSICEGFPGWLNDNRALLRDLEKMRSLALLTMVLGVAAILVALVYIAGGAILV